MRLRWPNKPKFRQRYLGTAIRHRSLPGQFETFNGITRATAHSGRIQPVDATH
jgi:hypothetical protein